MSVRNRPALTAALAAVTLSITLLPASDASGRRSVAPSGPGSASIVVAASGDTLVRLPRGGGVRVPASALPPGTTITITPARSSPEIAAISADEGRAWAITAGAGLTGKATLTLPYQPSTAPAHGRPLIAYLDTSTSLWLPVPTTTDVVHGTVTADVVHLSLWTVMWDRVPSAAAGSAIKASTVAAVDAWDRATNTAGNSLEWLSYQVNKFAFNARADPPTCSSLGPPALPAWVTGLQGVDGVNAFLYVCGEVTDPGRLRLRVVNNRAVGLALPLPATAAATQLVANPGEGLKTAFDQTFFDAWKAATSGRSLYLPPLATVLIDFGQPVDTAKVGTWSFYAEYNPMLSLGSLYLAKLLDKLTEAGIAQLPGSNGVLVTVVGCVMTKIAAPAAGSATLGNPASLQDAVIGMIRECIQASAASLVDNVNRAAEQSVGADGRVPPAVSSAAMQAEKWRQKLGDIAVALNIYTLGGFTIEAELAQAQQLGRFYVVYQPRPPATQPKCPSAEDILKAMPSRTDLKAPDIVLADRIVCAGPYVYAIVIGHTTDGSGNVVPQQFQVLLKQGSSGLSLLGVGTGPICSIYPEDTADGTLVVPPEYGKALHCIVTR